MEFKARDKGNEVRRKIYPIKKWKKNSSTQANIWLDEFQQVIMKRNCSQLEKQTFYWEVYCLKISERLFVIFSWLIKFFWLSKMMKKKILNSCKTKQTQKKN